MIRKIGQLFCLETNHTSYLFAVNEAGLLRHLYYGPKVNTDGGIAVLYQQGQFVPANAISYDERFPEIGLEVMPLEAGTWGKGDIRQPYVEVVFADGSSSLDLRYETSGIYPGKYCLEGLPCAYDGEGDAQTLSIVLKDRDSELRLELLYAVFERTDVITRSARVLNRTQQSVRLCRLMSLQLDFDEQDYQFTTFHGAWGREMSREDRPCGPGIVSSGSRAGTSGNRSNPFCMLSRSGTTEDTGLCIGFNLVYSGNHLEQCEGNSYGNLRFLTGIHPEGFGWTLAPGESFAAPEAVMTLSEEGFNGMSRQMHSFVRGCIVRGLWKTKPRPVLINSWESSYFHFNEASLLRLARTAADLGIELFVLDDGWFGRRNSDTCSLGDWTVNTGKLPGGLAGLAEKLKKLGMRFGLWVEPEMVNEDSDLYRAHPDWVIRHPFRHHSLGRNQMILNLALPQVREYLYNTLEAVFSSAEITYVKWDMNRIFSDVYGQGMEAESQPELLHRYQLGLYELMGRLVKRFPDILFEGCASGGNRFDLGILCYMPQIWTSDNTDAHCRAGIQQGTSYGYPPSVMSAHVSAVPNHQTRRRTPLYSRFAVAAFGVLGYECNLNELSAGDREAIRQQVKVYKQWREKLQYGEFYRLPGKKGQTRFMIVSEDGESAWLLDYHTLVEPNPGGEIIRTRGLEEDAVYEMRAFSIRVDEARPEGLFNRLSSAGRKAALTVRDNPGTGGGKIVTACGSMFNRAGFRPAPNFGQAGGNQDVGYIPDFQSCIYIFTRKGTEGEEEADET